MAKWYDLTKYDKITQSIDYAHHMFEEPKTCCARDISQPIPFADETKQNFLEK